jgi:uncharacterized protein YbjT (DUF2867 family)
MRICIAGATGLIGSELLSILLTEPAVECVWCVGRTPPSVQNSKLRFVQTDFTDLATANVIPAEVFFCTLGTTIRNAGSKENFRKVDHTYILQFAKLAEKSGAQRLLVVSSLGADKNSSVFYNQVKGDTEERLNSVQIPQIVVVRPSLLLGHRKESRPMEALFISLAPIYSWLLRGPLRKYEPIPAATVARALWHYASAKSNHGGFTIIENEALVKTGRLST